MYYHLQHLHLNACTYKHTCGRKVNIFLMSFLIMHNNDKNRSSTLNYGENM